MGEQEAGAKRVTDTPGPVRKRRSLRVAGLVLLGLLLITGGILTWLVNDTERVRRVLEDVVSGVGDRRFTIEGEFDYDLGRIITVRAGRIRWRNASESPAPYMLEVERFSGSLDLLSLLNLPVVITDAHVSDATLLLAWDDEGGFNWQLGVADEAESDEEEPPDPLPLVIDRASLENVSVRFHHPALTEELEIIVQSARHQQDEANRLVLSAIALLEDGELSVEGRLGPFPQLVVAGAVDFDLSVAGPIAKLTAAGDFDWLAELRDPDLVVELSAPSAVALAERFKLPLETTGGVQLNAEIVTENGGIATTARGAFGEYEVDADFRTGSMTSLQGLDATVRSRGPSMRGVGSLGGLSQLPDAPYEFDARVLRTDRGVELQRFRLDTTGLNIDASGIVRSVPEFRDIDLELTATGENVAAVAQMFDLEVRTQLPFELNAAIAGGGAGKADDLDARLRLGSTTATVAGSLSGAADLSGSELRFTVDAPDANQLAAAAGIAAPAGAALQARGSSLFSAERISFEALKVSVADAELTATGWLDRMSEQPAISFDGKAKGPDLAHVVGPLLPVAARSTLPSLPFVASTNLRLTPESVDIRQANARVGKSDLGFSGRLDMAKQGVSLAGELSAKGDSLAELLSGLGTEGIPDKSFGLKSRLRVSPEAIRIDQLSFTAEHARVDGKLTLAGENYSRIDFDLTGSGERLNDLIPENDAYRPADVPFNVAARGSTNLEKITADRFEAKLGDTQLEFSGEFQMKPTLAGRDIRLKGSGPRLSDLGELGGLSFADKPFEVSASMTGDAREQHIDDLKFESGQNNLKGRLRFLHAKVPEVEITLESSRLNLDEIGVSEPPAAELATAAPSDDRVFSDEPLPLEALDAFDAELDVRVDELIWDARRWRDLVAEMSLKQGVLEVRRAQVDAARGRLSVRGTLKPTPAGSAIDLEVEGANAMIAVRDMTPEELDQLPRHAIAARLSATGKTPHELAASLDGFAWIVGGKGQARRTRLDRLVGDFLTELIASLNPTAKTDEFSRMECQGMYFEIDNGKIVTSPAIVILTDRVAVVAGGEVDLASERIDFTFETTPVRGIGISVSDFVNPFIKLEGTLSNPRIAPNPKGVAVEGSLAVATMGLSVVAKGFWQRLFGKRELCERAAETAIERRTERDPGAVPDMDKLIAGTQRPETE
jgi:uncharacterized protein involved in outer membrane biogenesis